MKSEHILYTDENNLNVYYCKNCLEQFVELEIEESGKCPECQGGLSKIESAASEKPNVFWTFSDGYGNSRCFDGYVDIWGFDEMGAYTMGKTEHFYNPDNSQMTYYAAGKNVILEMGSNKVVEVIPSRIVYDFTIANTGTL